MTRLTCIIACTLNLISSPVSAAPSDSFPSPTQDQISHWLSSAPGIKVSNIQPVKLVSGEDAVLCSTMFPDEGRNSMFGAVLVRPKIEKAERIDKVGYEFQIIDIDKDGISEVITEVTGSGQGTMIGFKYILHLSDDEVIVLRKQQIDDNSGCCEIAGCQDVCKSTEVEWIVTQTPSEGPELSEKVVQKVGKKIFITKRYLSFTNGQFVEIHPMKTNGQQ